MGTSSAPSAPSEVDEDDPNVYGLGLTGGELMWDAVLSCYE